jgi:hypothetical protein
MPHHKIRPIPNESPNPESLFDGFLYRPEAKKDIKIPNDNVVYLRFPHPFDPYLALSPLMAGSLAMVLDQAQGKWNLKTFDKSSGLPTSLVAVDAESADFDLLKAEFKRHVGQNMITRGKAIEVERLAMTNEEAEYLQSRNFNKEEIYEVYGVPTGTTTDTGIKEQNREFINRTVWPLLEFIAGQITTQVAIPFFGPDVFVAFSDIRPQDRALAVQEATQYWPSLTLTETRQERGLDPLPVLNVEVEEGSPVSLWDDVPLRALDSFLALVKPEEPEPEPIPPQLEGFAGQPSMLDAASPDAMQELENDQSLSVRSWSPIQYMDDKIKDLGRQVAASAAKKLDAEIIADGLKHKAFDKWQTVALQRFKSGKAQKAFFDDSIPEDDSYTLATVLGMCASEAQVKAVFAHRTDYTAEAVKRLLGTPADETAPEIMALETEFSPVIEDFLAEQTERITGHTAQTGQPPDEAFWENEEVLLLALLVPFVERWAEVAIGLTVESALTPAALGIDANVNARAAEWAGRHALELAKGLNRTSRELAKARIRNWLAEGSGDLRLLNRSLGEVISPQWRASLIAQTEVTRARSMAVQEIARELGDVVKYVVWWTQNDEIVRRCPICWPLHKTRVPVGGTFPGGLDGPPAHPRCRCWPELSTG